jgi:hypothetical protein
MSSITYFTLGFSCRYLHIFSSPISGGYPVLHSAEKKGHLRGYTVSAYSPNTEAV